MSPEKIPETFESKNGSNKENGMGNDFVKGLSQLSQIGITMVVCILIGVFSGRFLDNIFNTSPWLLLIFSLLGAGAAFKYIYDLSKRM
ncbi:MAG: AtpZ/AtpI family protein [Defluviitaleaceae bacterium]|nr:AtpZ/AtpI family protein [Defluviitaleaceae bacterium]